MSEYYRKPIVKTLMLKGQEGQSIKGITKTGTDGLVDTYTITLTDGTTSTFTVTNGKEISSIDKTGTSGLVDTYTITFNDGTTSTFTVTNGDSAYKPAVDALGKRIDNLILSSGTESSAEVVDARNGYDGTTYDTLGTAIRTQVSELKSEKVNLPVDADGKPLTPTEGQTLFFKEDGTTYYGTPTISGGSSGGSGEDEETTTSGYVEVGKLPYTVGHITELYLEPSEDCTLTIGSGSNDNNLISNLADCLTTSSNNVIDGLLSEEYVGTHTVILTATNTNMGNNFYDFFSIEGLTVGTEYTFSCTPDLSGITGSAYGRIEVLPISSSTAYGGVYCQKTGERAYVTFTATETTARIRLYIWTSNSVKVGDAITYGDCLLCEGTSTEFGSSVSYNLVTGEKTKVVFAEGDTIPEVDGVTVTVYKFVESADGDVYVFLGDSIPTFDSNTGGIGAIPDYMKEKVGGTWHNFGIGGTTMGAYTSSNNTYDMFTFGELADSIASGDFAKQSTGVTNGVGAGSTSYSASKKVADMKKLDWSTVDTIFVHFGTNDLAYGNTVGNVDDTATKNGSMVASLKYAVDKILTAYPTVKIVICGIIYRHADSPSVSSIISANATIKEACGKIGIPYADLFSKMCVNQSNKGSFLYDGTHPNANGKERYAEVLYREAF